MVKLFVYHIESDEQKNDMKKDEINNFLSTAEKYTIFRYKKNINKILLHDVLKDMKNQNIKFDFSFDLKTMDKLYCTEFVNDVFYKLVNENIYRAWLPPSLHPTIGVHAPLVFDLVDTWMKRSSSAAASITSSIRADAILIAIRSMPTRPRGDGWHGFRRTGTRRGGSTCGRRGAMAASIPTLDLRRSWSSDGQWCRLFTNERNR